jgi:HlyD family secretion protein
VVITVDNSELLLKPGMTATARIVTAESRQVLRVPAQALRFTPTAASRSGLAGPLKSGQQLLWVARDGKLVSIPVTVGLVGETFAEIKPGDLKLADQVVTSEAAAGTPQASSAPSLKL